MYGSFMKKEDVLNYLNINFGEVAGEPGFSVYEDKDGVEYYSTADVENLFTSKQLWRKMQSEVVTRLFLKDEWGTEINPHMSFEEIEKRPVAFIYTSSPILNKKVG